MKKLFIFDMDGTLIDSVGITKLALCDYFLERNLSTDRIDLICETYDQPKKHDYGWGVSRDEQYDILDRAFLEVSNRIANGHYVPTLLGGARELLMQLHSDGHILAVLTAREGNAANRILDDLDIRKYFSSIKTGDEARIHGKKHKPEPDLIFEIMEEVGFTDRANIFMVGDTDSDVMAGNAAGVNSIAVTGGYQPRERLEAVHPKYIFDSLMDVAELA